MQARAGSAAIGRLVLDVPQTRDGKFYPACLEKGLRSERALKLAVAEMYLRGVSTRKVHHVMQKICGLDVTSIRVSRAAALLDEEPARCVGGPCWGASGASC